MMAGLIYLLIFFVVLISFLVLMWREESKVKRIDITTHADKQRLFLREDHMVEDEEGNVLCDMGSLNRVRWAVNNPNAYEQHRREHPSTVPVGSILRRVWDALKEAW